MTIHLELPAELEKELRARAAAVGKDVNALVTQTLVEQFTVSTGKPASAAHPSPGQFTQWLQAWIDLHPQSVRIVDDSRESVYAGRGE